MAKSYLPEGVIVKDRQVVIYLDLDGAEWLANELPPKDGFTRDLFKAVEELRSAIGGPSDITSERQ